MDIYAFIINNKEIFKIIYASLILLICTLIFFRSHKLLKLSSHAGIRYFRNAFLFFALAFVSRYFLVYAFGSFIAVKIIFEFSILMAGFFLLYSLIWKKFSAYEKFSSLLNPLITIFYLISIVVIVLDYFLATGMLVFFIQIVIFLIASILSFSNYKKDNYAHKFPKFYFITMLIGLFAWILNTLSILVFSSENIVLINIYLFNAVFFLIFLYGVVKITRK